KPVQDYPYMVFTVMQTQQHMVFTVMQTQQRPDWFKLPDLTRPYRELQTAVRTKDYNATKELIVAFKRSALTSDDLLTNDAVRIAAIVKEKAELAMEAPLTSRGTSGLKSELPPLESYPLYTPDAIAGL